MLMMMKMSHFVTFELLFAATVLCCFAAVEAQPLSSLATAEAANDKQVEDLSGQLSKNKDLWNKLLTAQLSAISSNSHQVREDDDGEHVLVVPMKKKRNNKLYAGDEEQQQQQNQSQNRKQKLALKKRIHKIVDDLIDGELEANEQKLMLALKQQQQNGDESTKKFEAQRKKSLIANDGNNDNGGDGSIVIIMKGTPSESTAESSLPVKPQLDNLNSIGQWAETLSSGANTGRRPTVNLNDHNRSILNDEFGILNKSKSSTNNHLGLNGMPKFGSDEEY